MAFSIEHFARQLLIEALFYDDEAVAFGSISLIDEAAQRELYLASYDPDRDVYLVEEAIEWDDLDADGDGEVDYALAVDGNEHGTYDSPEDAADVLLNLAREHNLVPSFMLLFEEDEA